MSTLNVDKVDPSSGTALELGTSGDTITVPTGAGLTVTDEVKTNKVSPATGTAFALGDSGDTFTVPSGATIVNSGTATGFGITQTNFLPNAQPLIINGDMAVSQRSTSVTGITGAGYKTVDRWNADIGGTPGTWTSAQEALTSGAAYTDGFSTALRWDCTTADGSLGASDVLALQYKFEGQDLQLFKKGTANAEAYTLAFWVKSNKTGTSQVNLYDGDNNRLCGASFTISSGDTWEHKVCNIAADTTGVMANDNAESMLIYFPLAAGSNYTGGAIPTAWETLSNSDLAASNLALADSTDNDFAITGIQLEVGTYTSSDLPPFQHESYGDNLLRCQRYCQQWSEVNDGMSGGNETPVGFGWARDTTTVYGFMNFTTYMRTQPTMSSANGTNFYRIHYDNTASNFDELGFNAASVFSVWLLKGSFSGLTVGTPISTEMKNVGSYMRADAEL